MEIFFHCKDFGTMKTRRFNLMIMVNWLYKKYI